MTTLEYYDEFIMSDSEELEAQKMKEFAKKWAEEEFKELVNGKLKEIKFCRGDEIYEDVFDEYSKEYNLSREENKWWGITIRKEQE